MIAITRSLARQLRAVFRRAGIRRGSSPTAWIAFLAQDQVLRIRLATADVAVEYCVPGEFAAEQMLLPYESLADFEGSKPDAVFIEAQSDGKTLVRWSDHGVPQMTVYDTIPLAEAAVFPNMPDSLLQNEPALWQALHDAVQTADKQRSRYALDSLRLRGDKGNITATDGRQILVQQGFQFPWHEDVLIPASALLGCREISCSQTVAVGRSDDWAVFKMGPWSVYSKIEKEARFPKLDDLFSSLQLAPTRLEWSAGDCRFLISALSGLPRSDEHCQPVTLDLNGQAIVRAADETQTSVTELVLCESKVVGTPLRLNTNRHFLRRAAELGFEAVHFFGPQAPAQCSDGQRKYLWALLSDETALQPSEGAIRIDSNVAAAPAATVPLPSHSNQPATMPRSRKSKPARPDVPQDGHSAASSAPPSNGQKSGPVANPIVQAEALRVSLRDALTKTNELVRSLKRQRRQSKLVQSTLAALQQLRTAS